jgi:MinD superfamily P-loop ATPase
MIIAVASGKGGTGKTTVAVNLACSLKDYKVQLLDCDVEEPNCHLFLNPVIKEKETVFVPVPLINMEKCDSCGKCAQRCRFRAITMAGDNVITFPELCHSCAGCMLICPKKAISEQGREIGTVEKGRAGEIQFIKGTLRIGEAMAPPLIRKVRTFIDSDAVNIIDAPPGTSCPVIASIKDADFLVLVTEPTPFGLHDLKLTVQAVKTMGIPCGLIINRYDAGDDIDPGKKGEKYESVYFKLKKYCLEENIPVIMEIPFDIKIAKAYSKGELIVDVMPDWKEKFVEVYKHAVKISDGGVK